MQEIEPALSEEEAEALNERESRVLTRVIQVPDDGQEYEIVIRPKAPPNAFADLAVSEPVETEEVP